MHLIYDTLMRLQRSKLLLIFLSMHISSVSGARPNDFIVVLLNMPRIFFIYPASRPLNKQCARILFIHFFIQCVYGSLFFLQCLCHISFMQTTSFYSSALVLCRSEVTLCLCSIFLAFSLHKNALVKFAFVKINSLYSQ